MIGHRSIIAILAASALPLLMAASAAAQYGQGMHNGNVQPAHRPPQQPQSPQQQQQQQRQQQQRMQPPATQPDNSAQKEIAAAREELGKATKAYDDLVKSHTDQLEKTPEFTAAVQAVTDASAEYDAAKRAAMVALQDKPQYKAALASKTAAENNLKALQSSGGSPDAIAAAANQAMDARVALTKMEQDATSADPTVQAKSQALQTAQAKLNTLRDGVKQLTSEDPEVAAAKQAKDAAQAKLSAAQQKLAAR